MNHVIDLRIFKYTDNGEYSSWFLDPAIDRYLGPAWVDSELEEIFADKYGAILSAYMSNQMVGVISVAYPHNENKSYGVTGIAVNPGFQRIGLGACILNDVRKYYKTTAGQEWLAFVSPQNLAAQIFLEKCGWKKGDKHNGLYRYTFRQ